MPNFDFDLFHSARLEEAQTDEEDELLAADGAEMEPEEGGDDEGGAEVDPDAMDESPESNVVVDDDGVPLHNPKSPSNGEDTAYDPATQSPLLAPTPFLPFSCSASACNEGSTCHKLATGASFDADLLERALVFEGSGKEVRRSLRRAVKSSLYRTKRIEDGPSVNADALYEDEDSFRILVLGGSVSNCRGVDKHACWHARVEDWFHRVLPLEGDPKPRNVITPTPTLSQPVPGPARLNKRSDEYDPVRLVKRQVQKQTRKKTKGSRKKKGKKVLEPVTSSGRKRPVTRVINGAKSATGSAFYAHCLEAEMETRGKSGAWGAGPDLVVLEFGVNDVWPTTEAATRDFEKLLFQLRAMPSKPAIVILEAASLLLAQTSSASQNAEYLHLPAAHFHDVPVLSTKHALFGPTDALQGLSMEDLFLPDLHHFNALGHELLADVLVAYFERHLCQIQSELLEVADPQPIDPVIDVGRRMEESVLPLPVRSLFTPFSTTKSKTPFRVPPPTCMQIGNSKSTVKPVKNSGWSKYSWARDKQYLQADKPGSSVTFDVNVGPGGEVLVDWLRSRFYDLGNVLVYLDNKKTKGKTLAGWWDLGWSIGVPTTIFSGVSSGAHTVTFELLPASKSSHPTKGTMFRLIGLITS